MSQDLKKRTAAELMEHYAVRRENEREHLNCAKCHRAYLLTKICSRLNQLGRKSEEDWKFAKRLHEKLWRHSKYFKLWKELAGKGLSQGKIEEEFKAKGWQY
jgi:hypothetical protein